MKIVKFCNDKYGIRSHWFFGWYYVDLVDIHPRCKWKSNSRHFSDCMGDLERVKLIYCYVPGKHSIVNDTELSFN